MQRSHRLPTLQSASIDRHFACHQHHHTFVLWSQKLQVCNMSVPCDRSDLRRLAADNMRVTPLYKHLFVPSVAPTLSLVGLSWKATRPPQFQLQVRSGQRPGSTTQHANTYVSRPACSISPVYIDPLRACFQHDHQHGTMQLMQLCVTILL